MTLALPPDAEFAWAAGVNRVGSNSGICKWFLPPFLITCCVPGTAVGGEPRRSPSPWPWDFQEVWVVEALQPRTGTDKPEDQIPQLLLKFGGHPALWAWQRQRVGAGPLSRLCCPSDLGPSHHADPLWRP